MGSPCQATPRRSRSRDGPSLTNPMLVRGSGEVTVETDDPLRKVLTRMMLFSEPPRQRRLRSLANRAFTPRRVELHCAARPPSRPASVSLTGS